MEILEYIGNNNTDQAANLCYRYGIDCSNTDDVINGLYTIADQGGAAGFRDILALHPDRDVIIENFNPSTGKTTCTGGNCSQCGNLNRILVRTNQADGNSSSMAAAPVQHNNNLSAMLQTNTLLVIGIVSLITVAFFLKTSNK